MLFEMMELTFRHWLPNFYECWWDHLLLDLFGCNLIGIVIGACLVRKFYFRKLNWIYTKSKSDEKYLYQECSAIGRGFKKLTPDFLMRHDWEIFSNLRRFYGILFYCVCINLVDLCNFFLKTILWVPPENDLLKYRLLILAPLGLSGTEEFFEYLTNKYSKRVRPHIWILLFQVGIELTMVFKHYRVYVGDPFPPFVVIMWSTVAVILLIISIYIVWRNRNQPKETEWNPYDPPIDTKSVGN